MKWHPRQKKPTAYAEWLNEMNNRSKAEEIILCAQGAWQLAPDKTKANSDLALVLAGMHNKEMIRAGENPVPRRVIGEKYNLIANHILGSNFKDVLEYVENTVVNFNPAATKARLKQEEEGERSVSLGYVSLQPKKGNSALGFVKADNSSSPPLGFLQD